MVGSKQVRKANKASVAQLSSFLPPPQTFDEDQYRFTAIFASDLVDEVRNTIWNIFETNMHDLYLMSSFGWDTISKRRELFDPLSRFILVHRDDAAHELVAFTMFRFEHEDDENILYCYELQVSKALQRHGFGKALMRQLASIGAHWRMEKLMLTALKSNTTAVKFYKTFGFSTDPSSPSHLDEGESNMADVDYEILSMVFV